MSKSDVSVKSLGVVRARGITRDDQIQLNGLGKVNVIFGRNGIGKSTVGMAIYKLLRPQDPILGKEAQITGVIQQDNEEIELDVSATQRSAFKNGEVAEYPSFESSGDLARYRLALEKLITEEDVEFAKVIADEMRGGIDLRGLSKRIGAKEKPGRSSKLENELRDLKRAEDDARETQKTVDLERAGLPAKVDEERELSSKLEMKQAAQARKTVQQKQADLDQWKRELETYPDLFQNLRGGEAEELENKLEQVAETRRELEKCKQQEVDAEEQLAGQRCNASVTRVELNQLKRTQEELANLDRELVQVQSKLSRQKGEIAASVALFSSLEDNDAITEQLKDVDWTQIDKVYQTYVSTKHRLTALEIQQEMLPATGSEADLKAEQQDLVMRHQILQDWFRAEDRQPNTRGISGWSWTLISAFLMVVWAGVLGFVIHPIWFSALVAPLILFTFYARRKGGAQQSGRTRQQIQQQEAQRFPELSEWTPGDVEQQMLELTKSLGRNAREQDTVALGKTYEHQAGQLRTEFEEAQELLSGVAGRFGLQLGGIDTEVGLMQLVTAVQKWQNGTIEAEGYRKEIESYDQTIAATGDLLKEALTPFGIDPEANGGMFRAEVERAENAFDERQEASQKLESARAVTTHARERLADSEKAVADLLERIGDLEASVEQLRNYEKRLPEYQNLHLRCSELGGIIRNQKVLVDANPEVKELNDEELDVLLLDLKTAQEDRDQLREEIATIRQKCKGLAKETTLADAIAAREAGEERLRAHRSDALDSLAGYSLIDFLINETESDSASLVFERAADNLQRITAGKLSLSVEYFEEGERFEVSDGAGKPRPLDQLSVGERVQVLLAVRLAFLSSGETASLPIVLDEALGTADDDRAHEIIESIVRLAKAGRQVFYFTAQTDEVEKWQAVLRNHEDIDGRFIDLDQLRGRSANQTPTESDRFVEQNIVPEPDNCTHAEYGQLLGIVMPGARDFSLSTLSTWALLDSVDDVYACWQNRIRTAAMLESRWKQGGALPVSREVASLAVLRAQALNVAVKQYWLGRPLPIEFSDLSAGGELNESWQQKLWNLAEQHEFDGRQLIAALEDGELKRWRKDNTELLESWLREKEKITDLKSSTPDEIEAAGLAVFLNAEAETADQSQWLLTRLYQVLGDYRKAEQEDG